MAADAIKDRTSTRVAAPATDTVGTTESATVGGWDRSTLVAAAAISVVVAIVVSAVALMIYDRVKRSPFAVIDLAGIVELEQMRLTASVVKPDATDDDRLKAFTRMKTFGPELAKAIEEVKKDCGCALLSRSAFVGEGAPDFTDAVKKKLGLDGVDADAVRRLAESAVNKALPSPDALAARSRTQP